MEPHIARVNELTVILNNMFHSFVKKIFDYAGFVIFRVRPFTRAKAQEIAQEVNAGDSILEIGSGWANKQGEYYFSMKKYFIGKDVDFITSDLDPNYGHRTVNIEEFNEADRFQRILCFHVLDDCYEWQRAWKNLYKAVSLEGKLYIIVPGLVPLDYTRDRFRFTEKLLKEFCAKEGMIIEKFERHGFARFPFAYYLKIGK